MDARRAFDQFERSGAGWLPLVLMILAATVLTGVTLAGVGMVDEATVTPQPADDALEESPISDKARVEEPNGDE